MQAFKMWPLPLVLLAIFTASVGAQTLPSPDIIANPLTPKLGAQLILTCSSSKMNISHYNWLKNFGIVSGQNRSTIEFTPLTKNDDGSYRCQYVDDSLAQSAVSDAFVISVGAPQRPTIATYNNQSLISSYTRFQCISESSDISVYKFYKDGKFIARQSWDTYYLYEPTSASTGAYSCTVENQAGLESEPSAEFFITLVEPPVLSASKENPNIGESLTLTCNTNVKVNGRIFTFMKGSSVIQESSQSVYNIPSLVETDVGEYKCFFTVKTQGFESRRSYYFFLVFDVPAGVSIRGSSEVNHGEGFDFSCGTSSIIGLEWANLYLDGVRISQHNASSGSSEFYQQMALFRNSGNYTCTLTNKRGESAPSNPQNLEVRSRTMQTASVESTTPLQTKDKPYVSCRLTNSGPVHYCSLYISGERYADDPDCTFSVPHAVSGQYTCSGSNVNSTSPVSKPKKIIYIDKPIVISSGIPVVNQNYTLRCLTELENATIDWFKGYSTRRAEAQNTDVLIFDSLTDNNQERYRCRVTYNGTQVLSDYFFFYFDYKSRPSFGSSASHGELEQFGVSVNSSFSFYCYGNGDYFNLYKNGVKVGTTTQNGRIMAFSSGNSGSTYACTLSNRFSESPQSSPIYIQAQDELVISPSSPIAVLGQPLNLTCISKDTNPDAPPTWVIYRINGESERPTNSVLIYDPVTKADEGLYLCEALIDGRKVRSQSYYTIVFTVPDKPRLTQNDWYPSEALSRKKRQISENYRDNAISLQCYCESMCDPRIPIRLYKNGIPVKNIPYEDNLQFWGKLSVGRTYRLDKTEPDIGGNYTCTGLNSFGESRHSDPVSISLQDVGQKPILYVDNQNPALGDDITFVCKPQAGTTYANYQFIWKKDEGEILNYGPNLTLHSLTVEDNGLYTCSITNRTSNQQYNYYTRMSDPIYIPLQKPLQPALTFALETTADNRQTFETTKSVYTMYKTGVDIPFECRSQLPNINLDYPFSSGKTGESYTLYKSGQVVESGNTLGLFNVPGQALGEYNFTCKATNSFGDSYMSYPLTLHVTNPATISTSMANPTLGSNLTLTCNTDQPSNDHDILWFKNGRTLPIVQRDLILTNLTQYDEGKYTCQQKIGAWYYPESDSLVIVFGQRAVKPEIYIQQSPTLEEGVSLSLYCLSVSTTSHHATFYLNGNKVATITEKQFDEAAQILFTYKIPSTTVSHSGDYTCTVENSLGESDQSEIQKITIGNLICPPGFFISDTKNCEACAYGTYQPSEGQSDCIPCPGDLFTTARGSTSEAQCIDFPDSKRVYLRVILDMNYMAALDNTIKETVGDKLREAFQDLFYFGGIQTHSVMSGTQADRTIVVASALYGIDVTTDLYSRLGFEIYATFYARTSSVEVDSANRDVKSVNMFRTQADALNDVNVIDIKECSITPKVCSPLQTCNDQSGSIGSFICDCIQGYQKNATSGTCVDIDECQLNSAICSGSNEKCVNNPGSYACDCIDGYNRRLPTDPCTNFDRTQQSLYPYGVDKGDTKLATGSNRISSRIRFDTGLPFGSEKHTDVYVSNNGMISVGSSLRYHYWGKLEYRFNRRDKIISPLMTYIDTSLGGEVLHQLYKKSNDPLQPTPAETQAVLNRGASDVLDNFGVANYDPEHVLVATWVQVRARTNFYSWNERGLAFRKKRQSEAPNVSTFQAIIITNGMTSYVIFMYKSGEFNWPYISGRDVAVGYCHDIDYVEFVEHGSYLTGILDEIVGNTGRFGTWMSQIGEITNPSQMCLNFYQENTNLLTDATFQNEIDALFKCPCSLAQMGRQWRLLFQEGDRACFALSSLVTRFFSHSRNKLCCYRLPSNNARWWRSRNTASFISDPPEAGFVTLYDPFPWSSTIRDSVINDLNPHRWCCRESNSTKLCSLFYKVRPNKRCSNTAIIISGIALGDPHINTMDGLKYTFNGWGEYIMADIPSKGFMIQARTSKATLSNGNVTLATVFTAFAAREVNDASFQVELSSSKDSLIIYGNQQDFTSDFYADSQFSRTLGSSLIIERSDTANSVRVSALFPSGVEVSISLGVRSLELGVNMLKSLQGNTTGLLGNFNGDKTDDFQLPNGTTLASGLNERQIFEMFGTHWAVTDQNSVFSYPLGESAADYRHPEFTPLFREDIAPDLLKSAETICGEQNDACIFDYVVTNSEEFANNTKNAEEQGDKTRAELVNSIPTITLTTQTDNQGLISVTEGQSITMQLTPFDDDGDQITFELVGSPAGVQINSNGQVDSPLRLYKRSVNGQVTYMPNATNPVTISVVAVDSKGGRSAALTIPVVVCTTCSSHGQCDKTTVRDVTQEGGNFQKYVCDCRPAYAGEECEMDFDACADNPCSEGQNCTDVAAADQDSQQGSAGHICGQCPQGSQDVNGECVDIDECTNNPCDQQCTNTIGSYDCSCNTGFRLNSVDKISCIDINECSEKTHNCEHKCVNNAGSYTCACEQGYTLNSDGRSCTLSVSTSVCSNSACDQVCVVDSQNNPVCSCRSFYKIDSQNTDKCVDIDECALANQPCDQVCTNEDGGYKCSCHPGFKLGEDKISCVPCESPRYGANCAQTCLCGGRSTGCDPVRGCICQSGWTGSGCDVNVNECATPDVCDLNEICRDLEGSFECLCADGYKRVNGTCVDVDECSDVLLNTCEFAKNEKCRNTQGSFSCDCLPGFSKNSAGKCEDIDECSTNSHNCQQRCVNSVGGFSCECYFGYRLDDTDRTKCVVSKDVCKDDSNLDCDHGCTANLTTKEAYCYCDSGYRLAADKQTCLDINECSSDALNGCSFKDRCVNLPGKYQCTCPPGFSLDNDERTCRACEGGTWGVNCSNDCSCSAGATKCDAVIGCVCKKGFTGRLCNVDINECQATPSPCESFEVCVNTRGNYSCQCRSGYKRSNGKCEDINECQDSSLNNCDQECNNFEGGYTCGCFSGFTYDTSTERCVDVNECESGTHRCNQDCINTMGSFTCSCRDGFQLDVDGITCKGTTACSVKTCAYDCAVLNGQETCFCPTGQEVSSTNELACDDIDLCQSNPCEQSCTENAEGTHFICSCQPGYQLAGNGVSCEKCQAGKFGSECSGTCSCVMKNTKMDVCSNLNGTCMCKDGWEGSMCEQDINECNMVSSPCTDLNSNCVNTNGSFFCVCNDGYFVRNAMSGICEECDDNFYGAGCATSCSCNPLNSVCNKTSGACLCNEGWKGSTCETDINECQEGTDDCASYTPPAMCRNTMGGYECDCPSGLMKNGSKTCEDIDECLDDTLNNCQQICNNTVGSFTCSCRPGYTLQPDGTCTDINECDAASPCGVNEDCVNSMGNYSCNCKSGFQRNGSNDCVDIDECAGTPSPCQEGEECFNSEGSYSCGCPVGYQKDSSNSCIDINECESNPCKMNEECNNTIGSYTCSCLTGYQMNVTGFCVDIDECLSTPCGTNQTCNNTEGSYSCQCPSGYFLSTTGECEDINECEGTNPCQQQCTNTVGGYTCSCSDGFVFNSEGKCVASFVGTFELRFTDFEPSESVLTDGTEENEAVKKELRAELRKQLRLLIRAFIDVFIKRLRRGSLIAEVEMIVDKETNTNAAGDIIGAGQNINLNNVTVNGTKQDVVEVVISDTVVTDNTDACVIRQKAFPCDDGYECVVEDGVSVCKEEDDDDEKTDMYIGIGIGVAVAVFVIIGVAVAACIKNHNSNKRELYR